VNKYALLFEQSHYGDVVNTVIIVGVIAKTLCMALCGVKHRWCHRTMSGYAFVEYRDLVNYLNSNNGMVFATCVHAFLYM